MSTEVISLITGIVGVIIGYALSFLTLRFNYHQLFAETVSKNRMEWINVWRENISIFLAHAETLHEMHKIQQNQSSNSGHLSSQGNAQTNYDYLLEMNKARTMITSRLNMTEELHVLMEDAVNNLDYTKSDQEFKKQCDSILEIAREILKPEWERVKREAKGK